MFTDAKKSKIPLDRWREGGRGGHEDIYIYMDVCVHIYDVVTGGLIQRKCRSGGEEDSDMWTCTRECGQCGKGWEEASACGQVDR